MTERGRAARSNRTAVASLRPEIPVLAAAMSLVANEDFQHVDMTKRAGEISVAGLENLMTIVANPRQFKIPDWFLNRKKDYTDGRYSQVVSNALDMKLRDDLELLKKIRSLLGPLVIRMWLLLKHILILYQHLGRQ